MAVSLVDFAAASTRAIVRAQNALDDAAWDSLERFGEDALPPSGYVWRGFRLTFPVAFAVPEDPAAVTVEPRREARARLTISVRYVEKEQT